MKYIFNFVVIVLLSSCTLNEFDPQEWAVEPELELSAHGVVLSSQDESYSFTFKTNYKEIHVSTDQSDWVAISLDTQNKTVNLVISANKDTEQRTATIKVTVLRGSKSLSKELTIYQVGGKWDIVEGTDIKLRWSYDISESQKKIIKNQIRDLVYVEGGTFLMGTQKEDKYASNYYPYDNETNPLHYVTLSDYYIGKYEVTQEQWNAVMSYNPSRCIGGNKPIENIKWDEVVEYLLQLSKLTGLSFSLPTSAQWEYAARGGKYSMGFYYPGSDDYNDVAHVISSLTPENSPLYASKEVGTLLPNELGLYDMAGNVSEMCSDWYGEVSNEHQTDPTGPNTGKYHVERGGDFTEGTTIWASGNCGRPSECIISRISYVGFRLILKY